MTAEQVRDCLQYYIGFFPARELDERTVKLFGVKLLPLDYETAMQAIDAACETSEAAKGFLPTWGAISDAYRHADEQRARAQGWLGQGSGWASAPVKTLPADTTAGSAVIEGEQERIDRMRAILRDAMAKRRKRSDAEHATYCRERATVRAQARADGRPYYTEVDEALIAEGLYTAPEELRARLVRRGRIREEGSL